MIHHPSVDYNDNIHSLTLIIIIIINIVIIIIIIIIYIYIDDFVCLPGKPIVEETISGTRVGAGLDLAGWRHFRAVGVTGSGHVREAGGGARVGARGGARAVTSCRLPDAQVVSSASRREGCIQIVPVANAVVSGAWHAFPAEAYRIQSVAKKEKPRRNSEIHLPDLIGICQWPSIGAEAVVGRTRRVQGHGTFSLRLAFFPVWLRDVNLAM